MYLAEAAATVVNSKVSVVAADTFRAKAIFAERGMNVSMYQCSICQLFQVAKFAVHTAS